MVRLVTKHAAILGAVASIAFACESTENETGGETNWFAPCDKDGDCRGGELRCVCGFCTEGECLPPAEDAGTCAPLPCPSGAPWNSERCRCEAEASTECRPPPCPTGSSWNFETCRCDEGADATCPRSAPFDPSTRACAVANVPEPPEYCVAPCVWEAVKRCLPVGGTCVSGTRGSPLGVAGGALNVFCQPETQGESASGWISGIGAGSRVSFQITTSAGVCYSGGLSPLPGDLPSAGNAVTNYGGVALRVPGGPVVCGTTSQIAEAGYSLSTPTDVPASLESYVLDPSRPECEAWDDWGFPRSPCAATTPGSCDGTPPPDGGL
jgi:hypothetical protein